MDPRLSLSPGQKFVLLTEYEDQGVIEYFEVEPDGKSALSTGNPIRGPMGNVALLLAQLSRLPVLVANGSSLELREPGGKTCSRVWFEGLSAASPAQISKNGKHDARPPCAPKSKLQRTQTLHDHVKEKSSEDSPPRLRVVVPPAIQLSSAPEPDPLKLLTEVAELTGNFHEVNQRYMALCDVYEKLKSLDAKDVSAFLAERVEKELTTARERQLLLNPRDPLHLKFWLEAHYESRLKLLGKKIAELA